MYLIAYIEMFFPDDCRAHTFLPILYFGDNRAVLLKMCCETKSLGWRIFVVPK